MPRPGLNTLSCVNPECQLFDQPGQSNLKVRKVYGQDQLRFLHCTECHQEFSERRGSARFNTRIREAKAVSVIKRLDEGCTVTGTARLVQARKTLAFSWVSQSTLGSFPIVVSTPVQP